MISLRPSSSRNLSIKRGVPRLNKLSGPWRRSEHPAQEQPAHNYISSIRQATKRAAIATWHFIRRYHIQYATLIVIFVLGLLQVAVLTLNAERSNSPIIGLHFYGQNITRANRMQIIDLATRSIQEANVNPANLAVNNVVYGKVTARQLGARYSVSGVVNEIYRFGRNNSILDSLITQDKALFHLTAYRLGFPNINQGLATQFLQVLNSVSGHAPINASIGYRNGTSVVVKEQAGYIIDIPRAIAKLRTYDSSVDGTTIQLPLQKTSPGITKKNVRKLLGQVRSITNTPLLVKSNQQQLTIRGDELTSCLQVALMPDPRQPSHNVPTLTFSQQNIGILATKIVRQFDKDPQPQITAGNTTVAKGQDGSMVDGLQTEISLQSMLIARKNQVVNGSRPLIITPYPVATINEPRDPQAGVFGAQIAAYRNGHPAVTLSFTGVPNATYTPEILNVLAANHTSAFFILTGRNVVTYPNIVKSIVDHGDRLGITTYDYKDISKLSASDLKVQLANTQAVALQASKTSPAPFQAPFNHIGDGQSGLLQQMGLQNLPGTLDALDWGNIPKSVIIKEVADRVKPGSVIMLHALNHTTVDALPALIIALHQKGYVIN